MPGRTVLTIGNFDGVHLGHQAIIRSAAQAAAPDGRVVAMIFDPHPATVLRPDAVPPRLTTFDHRRDLATALGVDEIVRLAPTPQLLGTSPEAFMAEVVSEHRPQVLVEGEDFRFGRGRGGDVNLLRQLGAASGFEVISVPPAQGVLSDHTLVTVSSSLIRWLLSHGRVDDAGRLLGRAYEVRGLVVRGDQRGRTIGVPTANVDVQTMLPGDGVYFGRATAPDGTWRDAAINVGVRPTFDGQRRTCEVHLLGADLPVDQYGWECRAQLLGFLRNELRFDGVEAVKTQIGRDLARAADLLERTAAAP